MKKLLCAVVLMTGTGVLADDAMKTAGNDINKAAGATKQAVKKAAIEIADASKKAARDVSTATKKAASKDRGCCEEGRERHGPPTQMTSSGPRPPAAGNVAGGARRPGGGAGRDCDVAVGGARGLGDVHGLNSAMGW